MDENKHCRPYIKHRRAYLLPLLEDKRNPYGTGEYPVGICPRPNIVRLQHSRLGNSDFPCEDSSLPFLEGFGSELGFFFDLDLITRYQHCENGDPLRLEEPRKP